MATITNEEIRQYWANYDLYIIGWFCVSAFSVLTFITPQLSLILYLCGIYWWWYILPLFLFIPINFLLKYGFGVKGLWFFNDTVDGDFGNEGELLKAGRKPGKTIGNFIWWWFRNHSWNFVQKFIRNWASGEAQVFMIISTSLSYEQIENNRWTWCSKSGIHGHHYIAAKIDGKVECRFSEANSKYQRQMGSSGKGYRFRFKNLLYISKIMFYRNFKALIRLIG